MTLEVFVYSAYAVLVLGLVVMIRQIARINKQFTSKISKQALGVDAELPSVTVCIPARNEQHALTDCLQKVIASTYEKLEIIVLDDVSGDDTSALIRSFASEGVRFVKGEKLPKGWLGKNHALQGLLNECSGSYVLFLDVDTRLEPHAIEHMMRYTLATRAKMISVLPRREDGWRASIPFSTLRYFWEIIFHRRLWPATASNAWLIHRHTLEDRFQGFHAFKNAIQPETKIATELAETGQYRFLVGTKESGVGYEKKWRSQLLTSVRLLYPLMGGRIGTSVLALFDIVLLLIPFGVSFMALFHLENLGVWHYISFVLALVYCIMYGWYAHTVWRHGWVFGALLWPYLLVQEFILIVVSTVQYLSRNVTWKGRSIQPEVRS